MNKWIQLTLFLTFCLVPGLASASGVVVSDWQSNDLFHAALNDPSRNFLEMLFGTVGQVLHGSSGMLLGQVFKVFNIGVIVVSSLFLSYSTFSTIISTAQEGRFMSNSQQGKGGMLIMRTVAGFGLLVPSFTTGYSVIQVFVMWVVLQGVGLANKAWDEALDYLKDQGPVMTSPQVDTKGTMDLVGTVLQMQVCMYYYENHELDKQAYARDHDNNPSADAAHFTQFQVQKGVDSYYFPHARGNHDNNCGQISWAVSEDTAKNKAVENALDLIIKTTGPAAKAMVKSHFESGDRGKSLAKKMELASKESIISGASDWINMMLPLRAKFEDASGWNASVLQHDKETGTDSNNLLFDQLKSQGWIYSGSYYYALGRIQSKMFDEAEVKAMVKAGPVGYELNGLGTYIEFLSPTEANPGFENEGKIVPDDLKSLYKLTISQTFEAKEMANKFTTKHMKMQLEVKESVGRLSVFLSPVWNVLNKAFGVFEEERLDPVMKLQAVGYHYLRIGYVAMILIPLAVFGLTAAGSMGFSSAIPLALINMSISFMPVFLVIIVAYFAQGILLTTYLPMIPFIIFTFGVIGWFIMVIEAMVAAPLVALGMTHPQGHDLLGKAQQAEMLMLSVFLRPILMIIGLVAGMLLSRVALTFLETGFVIIVNTTGMTTGISGFFTSTAVTFIYTGLVLSIVQMSFGMIHQVPDKVMRWIGVQADGAGQMIQQALSGAERSAGQGAEVGKGMATTAASSMSQGGNRFASQMSEVNKSDPGATASSQAPKEEDDGDEVPKPPKMK